MTSPTRAWMPWFGLLARLVTGVVWFLSGALKVTDPAGSMRAVRAYDLLPEAIVPTVGHLLPMAEILLGVTLILGLLTRASGVLSSLLFIAFIFGISWAWAKGLQIDCGCFGGGGFDADATDKYPWDIARDVGLLALSAWLIWRPATKFSLDGVLFRSSTPPETYEQESEVHVSQSR